MKLISIWRGRLFLALAGLVAMLSIDAAAAGPSGTKPIFETLQRYCFETGGAPEAVLAAAEADGLTKAGDDGGDPSFLEHAQVRLDRSTHSAVAVGEMSSPKRIKGYHVAACMVAIQSNAGAAQSRAQARSWVGVEPYERSADVGDFYIYVQGPDGRHSIEGLSDEALQDLAHQGRIHMMVFAVQHDLTLLFTGSMTPDAVNSSVPAAAAVTTPFDDFKALCAPHRGDAAANLQAAAAAGWMELPPKLQGFPRPYPMTSGDFRVKTTEDDLEMLVVGEGHMQVDLQILHFNLCGIMQAPPADRSLIAAVRDWIAMPPAETFPGDSQIYLFTEDAAGRHSLAGPNMATALARAVKRGPVSIVLTSQGSSTDAGAFVAYGVVTKVMAVQAATAYAQK